MALRCVVLCAGLGLLSTGASAQDVMAVMSSDLGPYRQALAGLTRELGAPPAVLVLSQGEPKIPDSVRVVVAFGSKAASQDYPARVRLVYALAPRRKGNRKGTDIAMDADASVVIAQFKRIAPNVNRIAVLRISPEFKGYVEKLSAAAKPAGVTIVGVSPEDSSDIPDALRRLHGKVDALWLPSDPLLLDEFSLPLLLDYSLSNGVPLFVPTGGLVELGATASVGVDFSEVGRLCGLAARKSLDGRPEEGRLYPTNVEVTINRTSAAKVGLRISEAALQTTDKIIP